MSDTISVYIHIPFCLKKCSYCDFYSTDSLALLPSFVNSLQREIEIRTGLSGQIPLPSKKVQTIYFGGGTPSLLPLEEVEKILETLYSCYQVSENAEITFEVNPGTVDKFYLSGLKRLGINRLSIGVQSFDADKIKMLNRIHRVEQSIEAIEAAQAAGFENIGLDLIYGTPGETPKKWMQDLKMALEFKVSHLSCYMLTLESGTPLQAQYEKGLFLLPDQDFLAELFVMTSTFLGQEGYEHYEISNFARGRENRSRHNSNYWQMTPYDGFGPSAHSFGFLADKDRSVPGGCFASFVRSWNPADVKAYIQALSSGELLLREEEVLSLPQQMLELVLLGLRTSDGLDITAFEKMSGQNFLTQWAPLLSHLETQKLGVVISSSENQEAGSIQAGSEQTSLYQAGLGQTGSGKRFALTLSGMARLDSIVEAFADKIL
ncbi:MAG: radical SAM family heme chaperone HemW [Desulfobacteraceae bacterium]|nr:radical SAM family heme chaperone HemW [Desulfobacteraceae bacterium]